MRPSSIKKVRRTSNSPSSESRKSSCDRATTYLSALASVNHQDTTEDAPSAPSYLTMQSEHHETLFSIFSKTHPPSYLPNGKMTELSFAKTFLSTLDSRPLKLQPDYTANPKTVELNGPYTLPKMSTPFKKATSSGLVDEAAQKPSVLNVTLKSSRNPALSLSLPGTELGTTVLEFKQKVASDLKLDGTEKIRVLYNKKPVGDVKTLKELVGDETLEAGQEIELGIMVMGYKEADVAKTEDVTMRDAGGETSVAQGPSGEEVLGAEEFWTDLKGFLVQRIRDEGKAGEAFDKFRESWEKR